jgi:hypothetical protein
MPDGPATSSKANRSVRDWASLIADSPEAISKRFSEMQQPVKSQMLIFNKMPLAVSLTEKAVGLRVAKQRVMRTIYEFSVLDDPGQWRAVERFIREGEDARFVVELPIKLVIIDERTVMCSMSDPVADLALTTLVIENAELARCLTIAFEHVWRTGLDFTAACERRDCRSEREGQAG